MKSKAVVGCSNPSAGLAKSGSPKYLRSCNVTMKLKAVVGCSNFVLYQEVAAVVAESNGDGVGYYCVVTTLPTS